MLWLVLIAVTLLIVYANRWKPPEKKPLPRQPLDHLKTFANRAAVHEAGHTVAVWCCTLVPEVGNVTIEAENGGITEFWHINQDTPESRWCMIVILLSGMAAEIAAYGKMRSGGSGPDLKKALEFAKQLADSGDVKPPWKVPNRERTLSFDKMIVRLDPIQGQILKDSYHMAHAILEAHGNSFYKVVSVLLTRKTATCEDIETVLGPRAFVKVMGVSVANGWFKPTFITPVAQA